MSQPTPGPWTIEGPCGPVTDHDDLAIVGVRGATVAQIPRGAAARRPERAANARLIAQAPAMRKVLQQLLYWYAGPNTDGVIIGTIADEARVLLKAIEP